MNEEFLKMINKGNNGKYKSLLVFKRISDGSLFTHYVNDDEDTEEIIKKCTSDVTHMKMNAGTLFELVYRYNYNNTKIEIIPFDELYRIKKGTFGYIDPNGNFYPLGDIEDHLCETNRKNKAGKIASNIVLSLDISDEEKEKYQKRKDLFLEEHYSSWNWPANEILKSRGYCLFFRGISADDYYDDQSYYENANTKQLFVLSYLYTINHIHDTDIEEKRKQLIKRCINIK